MSPVRRRLHRSDAERQPELVWNAFVDLIVEEDFGVLSPTQAVAHLAFFYDAEVQNGGHAQYFHNVGLPIAHDTVTALRSLGLDCQAAVLRKALGDAESSSATQRGDTFDVRALLRWLNPFRRTERTYHLEPHDEAYHRCSPTITAALHEYLTGHVDEFLQYVD